MPGRPASTIKSERCRPPMLASSEWMPVEMPDRRAVALEGDGRHVDRQRHGIVEGLEAAVVAAGFGQFEQAALGIFDLRSAAACRAARHRRC